MPQTRKTAKKSSGKIEDEIKTTEQLARSHREALESAVERLESLQKKVEEERRIAALRRKEEERRKEKERSAVSQRDWDLPWELMLGEGVCVRCEQKGVECYRVIEGADPRRQQPFVTNAMKVKIGKHVYSRCQECRLRDAKCRMEPKGAISWTTATAKPVATSTSSQTRKRKREASPDDTRRMTRSRVKIEEPEEVIVLRRTQLPTPVDSPSTTRGKKIFRVIPGSNVHHPIRLGTSYPESPPPPTSHPSRPQPTISDLQRLRKLERMVAEIQSQLGLLKIGKRKGKQFMVGSSSSSRQSAEEVERDLSYVSSSE